MTISCPSHCYLPPSEWPSLGSATSRTPHQAMLARAFGSRQHQHYARLTGANGLLFYSDGSASPPSAGGGSGAAFIRVSHLGRELSSRAAPGPRTATNNTAELQGVALCLRAALDRLQHPRAPCVVAVLLDCQVAIQASLGKYSPDNLSDHWLRHIWTTSLALHSLGHSIAIDWVPGHCGLEFNERCDLLAKQAAATEPDTTIPLCQADATFFLRYALHEKWNKWRLADRYGRRSKLIVPSVHSLPPDWLWKANLPLRQQRTINRIRLGNCSHNRHQHSMRRRETPNCDCGEPKDSAEHRILHCPSHAVARRELVSSLFSLGCTLCPQTGFIQFHTTNSAWRLRALRSYAHFLTRTRLTHVFIWGETR